MEQLAWPQLVALAIPSLILFNVLVFLVANLAVFRRPAPERAGPPPSRLPRLSVLVPARNEERTIGECLGSLASQDYPDFEVVLLDDGSTDRTAEIARGLGFGASGRLRIIAGGELPDGWTGKGWACHQLARAAGGDWLLFTDADTRHQPGGLRAVVSFALARRADLCSAWPRQVTIGFAEKLVIPLVYLLILGFLPQAALVALQRAPRLAARLPSGWLRALGAANGQFMLFRREAYQRLGGHQAVKSHLVEDVALGRAVAARTGEGMRLVNCDGGAAVSCRMYRSASELWEGFTKNLRQAFEGSPGAFVFSLAVQFCGFILPYLLVWLGGWWTLAGLAQIGCVILIRGILALRFGSSWLSVLLHPVGHGYALLIALDGWRRWAGGQVRWKDRDYSRGSLGE